MCDTELWLVEIIDWGHVTPKYSIPIGREPAVYGHLPYRHDFGHFHKFTVLKTAF